MWIAYVLFWGFATWLVVSPDKGSLTASRGFWGAFRGWANPDHAVAKAKAAEARADESKDGKTKAGKGKAHVSRAAQGSRWHGMLAGWSAGVIVARQRRAAGRDLWSIGSRFAGRTYGGGESLIVGVRRLKTDLAAWYRGRQYAADGPVVQGTVIDNEPMTETRDGVRVEDLASFERGRQPGSFMSVCNRCEARVQAGDDGVHEFLKHPSNEFVSVSPLDLSEGRTFTCPACGETYDASNYPPPPPHRPGYRPARGRNDLAADQAAEGAPAEGAGAPSNTTITTTPAFAGERMNLMTEMSIGELDNIGAVRAEAAAARQLIAMLGESIAAAKAWTDNLSDRWAGADWGTGPLNAAIAMVGEGGQALGTTELLEAGVAAIEKAIEEASSLAEMAAAADANGDVSRFVDA